MTHLLAMRMRASSSARETNLQTSYIQIPGVCPKMPHVSPPNLLPLPLKVHYFCRTQPVSQRVKIIGLSLSSTDYRQPEVPYLSWVLLHESRFVMRLPRANIAPDLDLISLLQIKKKCKGSSGDKLALLSPWESESILLWVTSGSRPDSGEQW